MTKMNRSYHIVTSPQDPRFCGIEREPHVITKSWRLQEGVPMGADFPPEASFRMDPEYGDLVPDFLPNILSLLMISPTVRRIMETANVDHVEYLPFVLQDKNGKVIRTDYCVANVLRTVDCIDAAESEFDALDTGEVMTIYRLNLDVNRIPEEAKLFRLGKMPTTYIVRSDLLSFWQNEQVTGLEPLDMNSSIFL